MRATETALLYPQVGDCYTHAFAFWSYVVKVTKKQVWVVMGQAPCDFPYDGTLSVWTHEAFAKQMGDHGYQLLMREVSVKGWYEHFVSSHAR